MNIALFSDTYLPEINGVGVSVNSLYKLLTKNGHNCYVVTTGSGKEVTFEDNVIRVPGLELKSLYGYRASFVYNGEAFAIIKKLNLDVIHVNTEFGIGQFGFLTASKLEIPVVYTYHTMYEDYTYYWSKGYFDRFSKWAIREFDKSCMSKATEIIAPSEKTMNYLTSIGIKNYVNIVPTGFDFSRFQNADPNCEKVKNIKEKYNLNGKRVLLCLGRIAKEKSFDMIFRCYRMYLDRYEDNDSVILLVGGGPQLEELQELSTSLNLQDRIIFTGKVPADETQFYYCLSDLFLSASISETQGLTFMEAMASSVPILCRFDNNLVGIIENNRTGFFFVEESDFIQKLHYVLSIEKKDMELIKKDAFKSIDKFSEKNFYDNIMRVYERAIRRSW